MSYTAQPVAPSSTGDVGGGSADLAPGRRDKTVISSPRLHRLQRRHFVLFDVLPFAGTLAAVALAFFVPLGTVDIALFLVMWLLTGLGLTVGFHRLFSHRAFATSDAMAVAFVILGSMAARGPMFSWVAMHRRHHERADHDGDMHSPVMHGRTLSQRARGWVHAHLTWMIKHDYPNVAYYVPDLQRNDALVKASGHYHSWVALGLVLPTLIGAAATGSWIGGLTAFLWGGAVRMFVVEQSMSAVNSVLHLFGSRPFAGLDDNSRNSAVLGLLVWGEGWHNNHHAFPYAASFGLKWYQADPGFWLIRTLQACGLVWSVKVPTPEKIAARTKRLSGGAEVGGRVDAARQSSSGRSGYRSERKCGA